MSLTRSTANASCVFVIHDGGRSFAGAEEVADELDGISIQLTSHQPDIQSVLRSQFGEGKSVALVIIALGIDSALPTARFTRRLAPTAELLFVVPAEELGNFRRKLTYVPLGQYRVIPNDKVDAVLALGNERLRVVRQRKHFRTTIDTINVQLAPRAAVEPAEFRRLAISDRYRASILASAGEAIICVDKYGYVSAWNGCAEELFQVTNAEGRLIRELTLGECGPLFLDRIQAVFADGKNRREEIICTNAAQSRIEIEATFAAVHDDGDTVIGVSIIARDISAANRARRLLRTEHQVARLLVEGGDHNEVLRKVLETIASELNAEVGEFWQLNETGDSLSCFSQWVGCRSKGLEPFVQRSLILRFGKGEGLPGRAWKSGCVTPVANLGHDNNLPRKEVALQVGLKSGLAFPLSTQGEFLGVMNFFSEAPLQGDSAVSQMVEAVGTDVAQFLHRVRAEEAFKASAERLRFMAESMPQKIFTATAAGELDYANQQWLEFSGLTLEQLLNWGWTQLVHPDDVEENIRRWKHCISTGEPFTLEHRFRQKDGSYRWHLSRVRALRDPAGRVVMWVGSNTDIDDQKRAEEQLERIVEERTAKLKETIEELEGFSYSISHDMRAPLRAMQQYAQILLEDQKDHLIDEGPDQLLRIMNGANRLDRLIQDILTYSRMARGDLPLAKVDVDRLVHEIISHYPSFQRPKAEVMVEGTLLPVIGHEAALQQCFSNLIANAVKFIPPGTIPHVRIWTEARGNAVRIFVKDNGVGIAQENQKRIFDIFGRVYPEKTYAGTGIGLSIVRKAVQRLGGEIGVESELGKGSTFWIELRKA